MALCSLERLQVLRQEAEKILERAEENPPAVGDGYFVVYDSEWATENGVGRTGRMTLKEGEVAYHAAHSTYDMKQYYKYDPVSYVDWVEDWQQGGSRDFPVARAVAGSELPQPVNPRKSYTLADYEQALFRSLSDTVITLVNPSFGTMRDLLGASGGYVTMTAGADQQWVRDIFDFVSKSGDRLKMLPNCTVRGVAYLGSNSPLWYPETPYLRLMLSPACHPGKAFEAFTVEYLPGAVVTQYRKGDRPVTNMLFKDTKEVVYNAPSVDNWLGCSAQAFFMMSNQEWKMSQVEDHRLFQEPWFVEAGGTWEMIGEKEWRVKEKDVMIDGSWLKERVVTDVRGSGTYLSRRSRNRPPEGYRWSDYLPLGDYWVTYATNAPRRNQGTRVVEVRNDTQKQVQRVVCMDQCRVVTGLSKFVSHPDELMAVRMKTGQIVQSDVVLRGEEMLPFAWQSAEGMLFDPALSTQEAAVFIPRVGVLRVGSVCPTGEIIPMMLHVDRGVRYVDVSEIVAPFYFAFPVVKSIDRVVPMYVFNASPGRAYFHHQVKDPLVADQVSVDNFDMRMRQMFTGVRVYARADVGVTIDRIMREIGGTFNAVSKKVLSQSDYYLWRRRSGVMNSEFVLLENIGVIHGGKLSEQEYCIDGMVWSEIIPKLVRNGKGSSRYDVRSLVQFLERNMFLVDVDEQADVRWLKVKRPRSS